MKEVTGDLWEIAVTALADAVVITTNGSVKNDGTAVMGRGVAYEAKIRWPSLPGILGARIKGVGNQLHHLGFVALPPINIRLLAFPVKRWFWEKADPVLITQSLRELVALADDLCLGRVVLPRPGCGNGKLRWEEDVRPLLESTLDDRFVVVNNGQ